MSVHLFSNYKLGDMLLANHVVMAPMTRCRCPENQPNDLVVQYYSQRTEAGLIITEGTSPSDNGLGYARMPGLFTGEHVKAWRKVTEAVHHAKSHIFVQLMHCGRVAHPDNMLEGVEIVAPSPVKIKGEKMWTDKGGEQEYPVPEELSEAEIQGLIEEFAHAADLAMQAGFDGVEIHGANGYLIDQFLNTASNHRTDKWGGSIENRVRFAVEVTRAIVKKIGAKKVGFRVSPFGALNGMESNSHTEDVFEFLAKELQKLEILYVHIVDHSSMGAPVVPDTVKAKIRAAFKGVVILAGGYDLKKAENDLSAKKGDLFAFGRPFISNPHLVTKLKKHAALTPVKNEFMYTPGPEGYIDYPTDH